MKTYYVKSRLKKSDKYSYIRYSSLYSALKGAENMRKWGLQANVEVKGEIRKPRVLKPKRVSNPYAYKIPRFRF